MAISSARAMKKIICESNTNVDIFKELVEKKVDHYCGFHSNCTNKDTCGNYAKFQDLEAHSDFLVFILFQNY
jgi:hypothetical protein